MVNFRLTPRAKEDLKIIGRYTKKRWVKAQRDLYLKNIEKRFNWLAEHPNLGKHRADVSQNYYSFPQGEHVVFYMIKDRYIVIIGIPNKKMDILAYFASD